MTEASPPNDDIYSITIECSILFDYLTSPRIPSGADVMTVHSPGEAGQTGPQDHKPTRDSKTTSECQIKYAGEDEDKRRTKMFDFARSFDLWINYTGTLAAVGRSLDDRLSGHTDIKEMVVELLQMLLRNLQYSMHRHDLSV